MAYRPGSAVLLIAIHLDEAAIELGFGVFKTDAFGIRFASDGDQQLIELHLLLVAVGQRDGEADRFLIPADVFRLGSGFAANADLLEVLFQFLRDLLIFDGNKAGQHFEDGHFGSKAIEDGGEFDTHRSRANNSEPGRYCLERPEFRYWS